MATVSFEVASRCPKCDNPGELMSTRPTKDADGNPSKIHILRCENSACRWYDTDWIVQQLEDGTVPVREGRMEKTFPAIPGMTQEKAEQQIKDITDTGRGRGS